jgi:hypothetical protein
MNKTKKILDGNRTGVVGIQVQQNNHCATKVFKTECLNSNVNRRACAVRRLRQLAAGPRDYILHTCCY